MFVHILRAASDFLAFIRSRKLSKDSGIRLPSAADSDTAEKHSLAFPIFNKPFRISSLISPLAGEAVLPAEFRVQLFCLRVECKHERERRTDGRFDLTVQGPLMSSLNARANWFIKYNDSWKSRERGSKSSHSCEPSAFHGSSILKWTVRPQKWLIVRNEN